MAKATKRVTLKKCQCCGNDVSTDEFYKSFSPMYKHDGLLPICKNCVMTTFDENLQIYRDTEKALYKTLFSLDVFFDIKLAKKCVIETFDDKDKHVIKAYFSRINLTGKNKTAKDSTYFNIWDIEREAIAEIEDIKAETVIITKEMIEIWGEGLDLKDYIFLQNKYDTMASSYGAKNPSSLWIYEQIALNFLDIKKEREAKSPNFQKIKTLQESNSKLMSDAKMKEAQVDNSDEDNMRFSKFIEMIEEYEPIPKDMKYDDYDDIHKIWQEDFVKPFAIAQGLESNEEYLEMKRQGTVNVGGKKNERNKNNKKK